ncbi:MAG TPA: hypothetical protein VD948_13045 [Rhodothermales bacterium]|nr:hypothetical protein [Rhodothermales bacterium]
MAEGYIGYSIPFTGEVQGATSATQFPSASRRACKRVTITARSDNSGSVFIGFSSSLTAPNGTSDATTGIELIAGQSITFHIPHTELIWYICSDTTDDFTFLIET